MPRRNRVNPYGEIIAVQDRGMFWGNRGCLHDRNQNLMRYSRGKAWAICLLEYKGIRRQLMAPGRLTELFFLDEATALAAGHRPCGECRFSDYHDFRNAWTVAHPGQEARAPAIDARLHANRLVAPGVRRRYVASLASLPDGAMVDLDGFPFLVVGDEMLAWRPGGYGERRPRYDDIQVAVITPRATVATLAAGYKPVMHPSVRISAG
ncbi:MAG: hypothetical protein WAM97_17680 [Acidimicrobiales bacterium]|jgi:hypothetical protein